MQSKLTNVAKSLDNDLTHISNFQGGLKNPINGNKSSSLSSSFSLHCHLCHYHNNNHNRNKGGKTTNEPYGKLTRFSIQTCAKVIFKEKSQRLNISNLTVKPVL